MRVLVVHVPGSLNREIRQAILGAGGECEAGDCIVPSELGARMSQVPARLVVVRTGEGLDVETVRDALSMVAIPRVAVGSGSPAERAMAQTLECQDYVEESQLRPGLEAVVHRLMGQEANARPRGTVISVYAPLPGSGGTTVAGNLAGAFAAAHPKETALVELARDFGDLALLLNVTPAHTARDACRRWQALDRLSLSNSFEPHPSGASVLVNGADVFTNEFLSKDAVRRLAVLSRFLFSYSVFALDSRLGEEELEVMRLSDRVVVVIRPDVVAVRRARWALDVCERNGISTERIQLVVNRWGQAGQLSLQQIESTLGMKSVVQIPDDPSRMNQATNQGVLLQQYARRASISRKFDSLAAKLNGRN